MGERYAKAEIFGLFLDIYYEADTMKTPYEPKDRKLNKIRQKIEKGMDWDDSLNPGNLPEVKSLKKRRR